MIRRLLNVRTWAGGLFWGWNIIFLAFMVLGFAPTMLLPVLNEVRAGAIPTVFLVYGSILVAIPMLAVAIGVFWLRREPTRLFALGYGVEGPLMLMLALRFFVVQDLTPGVALLIGLAGLSLATLLWDVLDRAIDQRGPLLTGLRVFGLTCLLVGGLYASIWLTFYAVPLAAQTGQWVEGLPWFFQNVARMWSNRWREVPLMVLGFILSAFSTTLFVLMPLAVPILYVRAWWRGVRALAARQRALAVALPAAVLAACIALFVLANRQPQRQAFALLETPPASLEAAAALLQQQETIRTGLLNAYLAPQRYLAAAGETQYVSLMYQGQVGLASEYADRVQQWHELIARPILYEPVTLTSPEESFYWENQALIREPHRAAELYKQFFDVPINEGEHDAVVRAVRSTWMPDRARNAWLEVDDREILLAHQELTIAEHGDWADMELYEVYQNQTGDQQEVVYYFSLPESAVITGIWLGNSADREQRFVYRVAPRGAAQAVYRNEVRRNEDPALVEQIGPRQYRLRVFPILPLQWRWDENAGREQLGEAPAMHMWLTWRVLAEGGQWPLPRLAEKRNVYWDGGSVRLVNGAPMRADAETWLPAGLPASATALAHRVEFPSGETVVVRPATAADRPQPAGALRLALVLDRSRSMAQYVDEVEAALDRLRQIAGGKPIDVYLTASAYRGEQPTIVDLAALDADALLYYGGQNPGALLAQFTQLREGRQYDAILVLSDGSSYELGTSDPTVATPDVPLWMIHLGGDFPLGYDDPTLTAIQASGGGVAGTVDEALTRLMIARAAGQGASAQAPSADVIDGYVWLTIPAGATAPALDGEVVTHAPGDAFAAFAARRLILAAMQRERAPLSDPAALDRLHAIAIEHSIVTPFSSMLVLVNEQQRQLLEQLEGRDDRFQREHEQVGETAPAGVTGVPEPEEWLLIGLAVAMLLWYLRGGRVQVMGRRPIS